MQTSRNPCLLQTFKMLAVQRSRSPADCPAFVRWLQPKIEVSDEGREGKEIRGTGNAGLFPALCPVLPSIKVLSFEWVTQMEKQSFWIVDSRFESSSSA